MLLGRTSESHAETAERKNSRDGGEGDEKEERKGIKEAQSRALVSIVQQGMMRSCITREKERGDHLVETSKHFNLDALLCIIAGLWGITENNVTLLTMETTKKIITPYLCCMFHLWKSDT